MPKIILTIKLRALDLLSLTTALEDDSLELSPC